MLHIMLRVKGHSEWAIASCSRCDNRINHKWNKGRFLITADETRDVSRVLNLTKFLWGWCVQVQRILNMWEHEDIWRPFGELIKASTDLWTAKKQQIKTTQLQFDLWPLKIKWSRASEGTDQVIKHTFCWSKTWLRSQMLQQATYKWLFLAAVDWISGNDWHLAQCLHSLARCRWLTIPFGWGGEPCKLVDAQKKNEVKVLSDTRWVCRYAAIKLFKEHYRSLHQAFETINSNLWRGCSDWPSYNPLGPKVL